MRVRFDHSRPVADNIVSFYFRPERPVRYTAGQFIELLLPHDNPDERGMKHWFTLSSSPTEELLAITTKFPISGPTSTFKQTLKKLRPGAVVHMADPMGDFVLPKDKTIPLVYIAGGIGVTPIRSMIKWLVDTGEKRDIRLLHVTAKVRGQAVFDDTFQAYGLPVSHLIHREVTADNVLKLAPDDGKQLYFIAGPEVMVEQLVKAMTAAGIPQHRLVGDYFPNYQTT